MTRQNAAESIEGVGTAADALERLGGSYLTRHSHEIAMAALSAPNDAQAIEAVRILVHHTSVGRRQYERWALTARRATGGER